MRSRSIKPGFFNNPELLELPFEYRILFAGLWTLADREGRLEDRAKKIKLHVFPGDDVDVNQGLQALAKAGFILRYKVGECEYIQVVSWKKHQSPHVKEAASTIPAPDKTGASMGVAALTPSSLTPDSGLLTPDSPFSDSRATRATEDEAWKTKERCEAIYPRGTFRGTAWHQAEREIGKLLDAGEHAETIVQRTAEYAAQCEAKGCVGTQFILSPAKFYADEWRGPFPLPSKPSFADKLTWAPTE